jgi:hypothetical protein
MGAMGEMRGSVLPGPSSTGQPHAQLKLLLSWQIPNNVAFFYK